MHADALRAAREALLAVKINGGRQRFTDEYADAMVRAAITAFLAHVKVTPEMIEACDDGYYGADGKDLAETCLAQLSREL